MTPRTSKTIAFAVQSRRTLLHNDLPYQRFLGSHLHFKKLPPSAQVHDLSTETNRSRTLSIQDVPHLSKTQLSLDQKVSGTVTTVNETRRLPVACPGCGALSQEVSAEDAGFYSRSRKAVKTYLQPASVTLSGRPSLAVQGVAKEPDGETDSHEQSTPDFDKQTIPVCDRCHDLIYNNIGRSIAHPSLEALVDSIAESPFDRNHVYHILDAADFPLSLIPRVFTSLQLARPRSQNRRAKFKFTKKPTMSFIITRSDLLGSSKEMVDKMLPYFQSVLRSALGKDGRDMRLGNVHLVSAKRGWWTKELKDEIWGRGGGTWMVGKVNVGKSNLFPVLFPKGSGERAPIYAEVQKTQRPEKSPTVLDEDVYLEEGSLLPPMQPEMPFPTLPIVSNLPGTTASPIRLSFGNHKGELIDLPGLDRGNLEQHVHPNHKLDLVMQHRPKVEKHIIKPGQSLLLGGGLIRITPLLDPNDPSTTMLAYPFVPLGVHVTATDKAIATQLQERQSGIRTILADDAGGFIESSGKRGLQTDVTKARAQTLLRAKVPLSKLPFRVYSTEILIEGVGWVELVCQVRRQALRSLSGDPHSAVSVQVKPTNDQETTTSSESSLEVDPTFKPFAEQNAMSRNNGHASEAEFPIPHVEIFSPNGKHVGQRKPLGASMLWEIGDKQRRRVAAAARPRKPMKGTKKREKETRRHMESAREAR